MFHIVASKSQHGHFCRTLACALVAIGLPAMAQSQPACGLSSGNFSLAVTVGSQCKTGTYSTAQGFFNALDEQGFRSLGLNYTNTSPANAVAGFNGLKILFSFPNSGSAVNFAIPDLDYSRTFSSSSSRDGNLDLLVEDVKKSGILSQVVNYQARNSPTSPITGAGGLIPSMVSSDFDRNFAASATNIASPPVASPSTTGAAGTAAPQSYPNLLGLALTFGSFKTTNTDGSTSDVKVLTLPLSYTFRNNLDPRRQLVLSLPIIQVDVNGAKSYAGGAGVAYRLPMNDQWTLVPSARASLVGSTDLATVAGAYTAGVTSVYAWELGGYSMSVGNMLSHNATIRLKGGEYSFDPDVQTVVLRNGVMLSQPVSMGGQQMALEYSLVDTRHVAGLKPFRKNYQEFGVTIGTNKNALSARSFLRAGLTYTQGGGSKGFSANIGYWF